MTPHLPGLVVDNADPRGDLVGRKEVLQLASQLALVPGLGRTGRAGREEQQAGQGEHMGHGDEQGRH